jgi:hypothetical protein
MAYSRKNLVMAGMVAVRGRQPLPGKRRRPVNDLVTPENGKELRQKVRRFCQLTGTNRALILEMIDHTGGLGNHFHGPDY